MSEDGDVEPVVKKKQKAEALDTLMLELSILNKNRFEKLKT